MSTYYRIKKKSIRIISLALCIMLFFKTGLIVTADIVSEYRHNLEFCKMVHKAKIEETVYENIESDGKVNVYIWLADIDYNEVEKDVEKEIGYSANDLFNRDEIDLNNMERSKEERKIEKEKTEMYVTSKRRNAKECHRIHKNDITELDTISDSVIYESKYVPLVLAELTIEEIEWLAESNEVTEIGYYDSESTEFSLPEFNTGLYDKYDFFGAVSYEKIQQSKVFLEVTGVYELIRQSGLHGEGVEIGVLEGFSFLHHEYYLPKDRCFSNQNYTHEMGDEEFSHSTSVALLMSGSTGIAPKSTLYMIENYSTNDNTVVENYIKHMEELIEIGVAVISLSAGFAEEDAKIVGMFTDYVVSNYNVTVVNSAGNMNHENFENSDSKGMITHPGNSDNVITVGAMDNKMTIDRSDDEFYYYNSDIEDSVYEFTENNDGNQTVVFEETCMKPDLVAPANVFVGGTSMAAPYVTGIVALMLECRPSLELHPEVIKAILMASCHYKANPHGEDDIETMEGGLGEKQGAGVVDPYLALSITANGCFDYGTINENALKSHIFYQLPYDSTGVNVSLAWIRDVDRSTSGYNYTKRNDLELTVLKNGVTFGPYENASSSTEMVYLYNNTNTRMYGSEVKYEILVNYENDDTDNSTADVRYGYAWSSDTDKYFRNVEYEGIYVLKNLSNNRYLTYNWDYGTLSLKEIDNDYMDSYDQHFVISRENSQGYIISLATSYVDSAPYFIFDGLAVNGENVIYSETPSFISIFRNYKGQYMFYCDSKFLNYNNGLKWDYLEYTLDNEFWVIEKINYRKGDIDFNGVVDEYDYTYLSEYCSGVYLPSNGEKYLSDMNGDHVLDDDLAVFNQLYN